MPKPVDVGSVLGGRYKVTGRVLASAEEDLVLDGVDRVLNRAVSILVAAPANATQVTSSARELATGERSGTINVLDLGVSDGQTYLITNKAEAADLLDLVIEQDGPYVEPFFTDTLGSEIFGVPRSREPETQEEDEEDRSEPREARKPLFSNLNKRRLPKFGGREGQGASAASVAGAAGAGTATDGGTAAADEAAGQASKEQAASPPTVEQPRSAVRAQRAPGTRAGMPPRPSSPPRMRTDGEKQEPSSLETAKPKVSLWSDRDYSFINAGHDSPAEELAEKDKAGTESGSREQRRESRFPAAAIAAGAVAGGSVAGTTAESPATDAVAGGSVAGTTAESPAAGGSGAGTANSLEEHDDDAEERSSGRKVRRALVGAVFAAILITVVVLAVNNLGGMFGSDPAAAPQVVAPASPEPSTAAPSQAAPSQGPTTAPDVTPEAVGINRLVPDLPNLNAESDGDLPLIIDNNEATFWRSYVFANNTFGGLAQNMALVIELQEPSAIRQVEIQQLNGTGGSFGVQLNDRPSLDGARQVAQSSFTAPIVSIPIAEESGEAAKAQYIIINFTELPRLTGIQAQYPWGLQIAEIKVS